MRLHLVALLVCVSLCFLVLADSTRVPFEWTALLSSGMQGMHPWAGLLSEWPAPVLLALAWARDHWLLLAVAVCAVVLLYNPLCVPLEWRREVTAAERANAARRRAGPFPPAYPNGYFRLCDSKSLTKGKVLSVSALGQHFAVYRGENGKAVVMDAYCPHLGADMSVLGTVVGDCLRCPFHGWEFRGTDGMCTNIPYSKSIPSIAKATLWPSIETNGIVAVWFHAEGDKPRWTPPSLEGINSGRWVRHGQTEHKIAAHIQEIPENGSDLSHFNILHNRFPWLGAVFKHIWHATWEAGTGEETHLAHIKMTQKVTLFGSPNLVLPGSHVNVTITQIGAGIVHLEFDTLIGKMAVIETVTPLEPFLQVSTHTLWAAPLIPRFVGKFVLQALIRQFEMDIPIWSSKTFLTSPMVIKGDGPIMAFRKWYSQWYSLSSPPVTTKPATLDW